MESFSVSLILAAAGNSTRFGSDKLGQDLGGRPLLLRSVELFTKRDEVRSIIVAAPPENMTEFRDRFGARHCVQANHCSGGRTNRKPR